MGSLQTLLRHGSGPPVNHRSGIANLRLYERIIPDFHPM